MHPFPVGRKDARPATVRDQRGMSRSRRSRHYRIRSESVRCAPSGGWSVRAGRGRPSRGCSASMQSHTDRRVGGPVNLGAVSLRGRPGRGESQIRDRARPEARLKQCAPRSTQSRPHNGSAFALPAIASDIDCSGSDRRQTGSRAQNALWRSVLERRGVSRAAASSIGSCWSGCSQISAERGAAAAIPRAWRRRQPARPTTGSGSCARTQRCRRWRRSERSGRPGARR